MLGISLTETAWCSDCHFVLAQLICVDTLQLVYTSESVSRVPQQCLQHPNLTIQLYDAPESEFELRAQHRDPARKAGLSFNRSKEWGLAGHSHLLLTSEQHQAATLVCNHQLQHGYEQNMVAGALHSQQFIRPFHSMSLLLDVPLNATLIRASISAALLLVAKHGHAGYYKPGRRSTTTQQSLLCHSPQCYSYQACCCQRPVLMIATQL